MIWLYSSINKNKRKTILLILYFLAMIFSITYIATTILYYNQYRDVNINFSNINYEYIKILSYIIPILWIWIFVAFKFHQKLIFLFSWAKEITRKDNPKIYNIIENFCIQKWITNIPKIWIINTNSLNAFAVWRKPENSRIVFTSWLLETLNTNEIQAVAGHEMTHILNKDTLISMIIIIIIWFFSSIWQLIFRIWLSIRWNKDNVQIKLWLTIFWWIFLLLWVLFLPIIRFAISRKREFLADAWSVELTHDNISMINALKKISQHPYINSISKNSTMASMFIENPIKESKIKKIRSTHPSIEKRINALKWY